MGDNMKMSNLILTAVATFVIVIMLVIPVIQINENQNELDIIIIAGQSNAEYGPNNGTTDPEILNEDYTEKPTHNLYYFGSATRPPYAWWSIEGMTSHNMYNYDTEKYIIGGYEPILANGISNKTGNDVYIINTGVGARTVEELNPYNEGRYGIYVDTVVKNALIEMPTGYDKINKLGFVWIQGESDKATAPEQYIQNFDGVLKGYSKFGFNDCFVVHTRNYYGGNANYAISKIISTNNKVSLVSTISETFTEENNTLVPNQPIHYNQHGRDLIADEIVTNLQFEEEKDYSQYLMIVPVLLCISVVIYVGYGIIKPRFEY